MAGSTNSLLGAAKVNKNDEFYTQLVDIEKEIKNYRDHFRDKVVLCNCDDPYESNFFKYFALNFNALGLKKLIATCYDGSPITGNELTIDFDVDIDNQSVASTAPKRIAYKIEITEVPDVNSDGAVDLTDVKNLIKNDKNVLTKLRGNGDFRSDECIELLKQADIVCTNPPFSLFREYVAQLVKYEKKFLIIGNQNAITYKEIFPLIKENELWLGLTMNGSNRWFQVPDNYQVTPSTKIENGKKYCFVKSVVWFTNLEHNRRHEEIIPYKKYTPEEYPKYDNYDAIEVDRVDNIPIDYNGIMGVPITFLHKYCPEQFEILDARDYTLLPKLKTKNSFLIKDADGAINGKPTYARILIRKK